ncbi:HipA domain-containing protein, partial [mine drainage metagenome]
PEDMGCIEMAYAQMARAAGVYMPETKLVSAVVRGKKQNFFAVKRFDRNGNEKKHVITLGGMLEASHRVPSLDYSELLKAVSFATKDAREVTKAFRMMVFNVLAHNKDDHVRNFSLMLEKGKWLMTPAYDLTFSQGMNNYHMMAVSGEGNPTLNGIRALAAKFDISDRESIMAEVLDAVSSWPNHAKTWGVSAKITKDYQKAMLDTPCRAALLSKGIKKGHG